MQILHFLLQSVFVSISLEEYFICICMIYPYLSHYSMCTDLTGVVYLYQENYISFYITNHNINKAEPMIYSILLKNMILLLIFSGFFYSNSPASQTTPHSLHTPPPQKGVSGLAQIVWSTFLLSGEFPPPPKKPTQPPPPKKKKLEVWRRRRRRRSKSPSEDQWNGLWVKIIPKTRAL